MGTGRPPLTGLPWGEHLPLAPAFLTLDETGLRKVGSWVHVVATATLSQSCGGGSMTLRTGIPPSSWPNMLPAAPHADLPGSVGALPRCTGSVGPGGVMGRWQGSGAG